MRSRIESRGAAHKSLHPSRELKAILQRHWQSHQAASEDELQVFDAQVAIDVETHVVEKALQAPVCSECTMSGDFLVEWWEADHAPIG
ncbi:unnamed protein product [Effrenium voratum]|nr:unnamed protein product [Effrenium voratum]